MVNVSRAAQGGTHVTNRGVWIFGRNRLGDGVTFYGVWIKPGERSILHFATTSHGQRCLAMLTCCSKVCTWVGRRRLDTGLPHVQASVHAADCRLSRSCRPAGSTKLHESYAMGARTRPALLTGRATPTFLTL